LNNYDLQLQDNLEQIKKSEWLKITEQNGKTDQMFIQNVSFM